MIWTERRKILLEGVTFRHAADRKNRNNSPNIAATKKQENRPPHPSTHQIP